MYLCVCIHTPTQRQSGELKWEYNGLRVGDQEGWGYSTVHKALGSIPSTAGGGLLNLAFLF